MIDLRMLAVGTRVVVRYRIADGRATDALGDLVATSETHVSVQSKRGTQVIALIDVVAARPVPPPPTRRTT